ncbi:membrane protein [Brachyspira hyodysenteriae]|uniref:LysM peptidoglycan-binding domain-containing protein n=1 Tax=Brachyspira hyodysenteriae TaxID=159 RepID=UPI00063DAE64|nr:LysM peptidoglycan-binding domain-containing protein [Brachyspira hyodysenteriae]KLI50513.1 membrane protein [Brachyspira hyodysenteriae]
MKKGLFLFILLTFSCFLYAQETNELVLPPELPADLPASIKESDDYKLAQRYREMAIDAHSVGDYNQSIEYSRQSKEYSDKIILRYGVYEYVLNSQRDAERKLSLFKGVGGDTNELTTSLYEESVTDINSAHSMLEASTNSTDYTNTMLEYNKSAEKSELGYNVLAIDLRREYLMSESVLTNGDNNDTQITNLRDESKNALSNGDYTNSLTKSREAMNILDMLEAPLAYAKAQDSMDKAKQDGFNNSKPNLYTEALKSLSSAGETLIANNYTDSLMHSKNVISLVNSMESTSGDIGATEEVIVTDGTVFPQYYIVQSRRANTDSLWRIASYDFIYGNGNLWRRIYEANRDTIKDPNVIRAGQRLVIPSLKGETRQGTYSTNQTYGNITTFSTNQIEGNIIIEDEEAMEAQAEQTEETVIDEQTDTADENAEMTEDTTTADENAEMTEDTAATYENTEMTEDTAATDENTEMTEDDTTVTDETAAEEGNQ